MITLKAIIVDDELHGRNNLHSLLKSYCPEVEVIGKCGKPFDAKKMIYDMKPDIVFLDVHMPQMNGFELLESLPERNFLTVIVSAHSEYGIKAVKSNVVDYLLKPIDINELEQSVKKLLLLKQSHSNGNHDAGNKWRILVSHSEGKSIIDINEIIWLEGKNNYTLIHIRDKKSLTVAKTLKEFESSVKGNNFFRVHKSDIINLNYISDYTNHDGGFITMKGGVKITISRRRIKEFEEAIKEYSLIPAAHRN